MLYLIAVFHLQLQWTIIQMQVLCFSACYLLFAIPGARDFFKPFAGMHPFVFLHVHWQTGFGLILSLQCSRCYSDINNKLFPERNVSPGILSQDLNSAQRSGPCLRTILAGEVTDLAPSPTHTSEDHLANQQHFTTAQVPLANRILSHTQWLYNISFKADIYIK